jgi:hypothetical protein
MRESSISQDRHKESKYFLSTKDPYPQPRNCQIQQLFELVFKLQTEIIASKAKTRDGRAWFSRILLMTLLQYQTVDGQRGADHHQNQSIVHPATKRAHLPAAGHDLPAIHFSLQEEGHPSSSLKHRSLLSRVLKPFFLSTNSKG